MKILCIDVGNTHIHYGLVDGQKVSEASIFPTEKLLRKAATEWTGRLQGLASQSDGIAFCSVVPTINTHLKAILSEFNHPVFQLDCRTCIGIEFAYPNPEEIGHDRIANAIAAQEFYGVPAVIIDIGTAVTFDIVSQQGYEGGLIAPGLKAMTHCLHEQTALLPSLDQVDLLAEIKQPIGKSTTQAMQLGIAIGFSGMIHTLKKHVIAELTQQEGKAPVVLSTGGGIANLAEGQPDQSCFVENLTLLGLAVAFERTHR